MTTKTKIEQLNDVVTEALADERCVAPIESICKSALGVLIEEDLHGEAGINANFGSILLALHDAILFCGQWDPVGNKQLADRIVEIFPETESTSDQFFYEVLEGKVVISCDCKAGLTMLASHI